MIESTTNQNVHASIQNRMGPNPGQEPWPSPQYEADSGYPWARMLPSVSRQRGCIAEARSGRSLSNWAMMTALASSSSSDPERRWNCSDQVRRWISPNSSPELRRLIDKVLSSDIDSRLPERSSTKRSSRTRCATPIDQEVLANLVRGQRAKILFVPSGEQALIVTNRA